MERALERALVESQVYAEQLRTTADKSSIRLTNHDDEIFLDWQQTFPDVNVKKLATNVLRRQRVKIDAFISRWRGSVDDPLAPAVLRKDGRLGFTPDNVVLVSRILALATEVARNRSA